MKKGSSEKHMTPDLSATYRMALFIRYKHDFKTIFSTDYIILNIQCDNDGILITGLFLVHDFT